jgi:RNA polymerase sigma-70 factor (ECF subfamily)
LERGAGSGKKSQIRKPRVNIPEENASNPTMGPLGPVPAGTGEGVAPDEDVARVLRAQAGELRAFDELVTRHRSRVYAMIRNMIHHEADAWDLAQEVFIKAWGALPRFEAKARFSTWLYRIAHNVVYDWTRRRRPESGGDELNDETLRPERIDPASRTTPAAGRRPDEELSNEELRVRIEAALARLSPEHREVVLLKDVQGLAYKEIAEVTGATMGTVMSRLYYARQRLQTLLKGEHEARWRD